MNRPTFPERALFAADGQEPLFGVAECDALADIAAQSTAEDAEAARSLARWARGAS